MNHLTKSDLRNLKEMLVIYHNKYAQTNKEQRDIMEIIKLIDRRLLGYI